MSHTKALDPIRRRLLLRLCVGLALAPVALFGSRRAGAADLPLLDASSSAAKKVGYVRDASQAKAASTGSRCATCAMYQGAYGSKQGACHLFPGKDVTATGWCTSWEPQM